MNSKDFWDSSGSPSPFSICQTFLVVVMISQLFWLIHLFGTSCALRWLSRGHKSALFLKYAPSHHLFLRVQGESALGPVYPAMQCQEINPGGGGGWEGCRVLYKDFYHLNPGLFSQGWCEHWIARFLRVCLVVDIVVERLPHWKYNFNCLSLKWNDSWEN